MHDIAQKQIFIKKTTRAGSGSGTGSGVGGEISGSGYGKKVRIRNTGHNTLRLYLVENGGWVLAN